MEVLTQLEADIKYIVEFKVSTAQTQKKVVGHLVTYSIVIYLLVAIFAYFKLFPEARTTKDQFLLLLPFLISPFLIWLLRRFLTWWYHRKIIKNEKKLELLKQRKLKILDEVMEKETYKVAKEILDKFGDKSTGSSGSGSRPTLPGLSGVFKSSNSGPSNDNQLRRRPLGDPSRPGAGLTSLNTSLPASVTSVTTGAASNKPGVVSKLNATMTSGPASTQLTGQPRQPPSVGPAGGQLRQPPSVTGGRPGPPLPRPILPRERGYLDKFVEFLVGDGPSNRYALICRQCESHNGMALREEFEYVAFRCCYCYYWNPARKQRPVAPRLTAAAERPLPAANSSESSGSDVSAPPSAAGSRRGSVSKLLEAKVLEYQEKTIQGEETENKMNDVDEGSDQKSKDTETKEENSDNLVVEVPDQKLNTEESVTENAVSDNNKVELVSDNDTTDDANIKSKDTNENVMEVDS